MTEQTEDPQLEDTNLTRAFSIPIFALFFAVLLINTRPIPGDSNAIRWITFPDALGGDSLRNGLRNIAITFGLSCFPGAVIGTGLTWLIARHAKLATGSMVVLRICQWAPVLLWWVLTWALIYAPSERPDRYFFVWTMGIPAVALGSCYHMLCLRLLTDLDWQRSICETAGLAIHRGMFISIVLTLNVWMANWVVNSGNHNIVRHYIAAFVLMLFLFIANWIKRADISQSVALRRQLIVNDIFYHNQGAFWSAALIVAALGVIWQLLSSFGILRVSLVSVLSATPLLVSTSDLLHDTTASLLELIAGFAVSGIIVAIMSPFFSQRGQIQNWALLLLSLTFAVPMILLPAWQGWALSKGTQSNHILWQSTCVAALSFFPLMQAVWTLRTEHLATKLLLAIEQALPYGFAALIFGDAMSATKGLGFGMIVAGATQQLEKGFAIFLLSLGRHH